MTATADDSTTLTGALKWPVIFLLAFTSVPAGMMPAVTVGAILEQRAAERVEGKWRDERGIHNGRQAIKVIIVIAVILELVQLGMVTAAYRNWNGRCLGLRGGGWFVMLWSAFAVGVAFSIVMLTFTHE